MASLNRVMLIGNLGKDPEIKYAGETCIANFSLATRSREKDKSGNYSDVTEWHFIKLFGQPAQVAEKWLSKGAAVHIEGRIKTERWKDKDGAEKSMYVIIGERLTMLSSAAQKAPEPAKTTQRQPAQPGTPEFWQDNDGDLPF